MIISVFKDKFVVSARMGYYFCVFLDHGLLALAEFQDVMYHSSLALSSTGVCLSRADGELWLLFFNHLFLKRGCEFVSFIETET